MEVNLSIRGSDQEVSEFFTALVGNEAGSILEKLNAIGAISKSGPSTDELYPIVKSLSWTTIYLCHLLAQAKHNMLSTSVLKDMFDVSERAAAARVGGLVKVCKRNDVEPFIKIKTYGDTKTLTLREGVVPIVLHYLEENSTAYADWLSTFSQQ